MSGLRLRYRISLAVIAIMLVCCMFLGSSYALWKVEFTQEQENVIKTGCFEIVWEDTGSNSINLDKAYPIENVKGLASTPYTFTLKNDCTIDASYKLYLNVLKVEAVSGYENNATASAETKKTAGQIPDDNIMYSLTKSEDANATANKITTLTKNTETTSFDTDSGKEITTSYILDGGTSNTGILLKAGAEQKYSLRLWISRDATTEINYKKFEAELATIAYAVNTPSTEEVTG